MSARWSCLVALACLLSSAARAQEISVFVVIENPTNAELVLQVEDQVCASTAFDGLVEAASTLTLALCADEHGLAQMVMTNPSNGQVSQRSVASGATVTAP